MKEREGITKYVIDTNFFNTLYIYKDINEWIGRENVSFKSLHLQQSLPSYTVCWNNQ